MSVTFQLPGELEEHLRRDVADFDAAAKEAMLIEFYRQDKISRYELSQALGLGRIETDGVLKKHNVTEDLPTTEELEEDLRNAMELMKK
jgi:hypothetical protein